MNFNLKENQHHCIYREPFIMKKPYVYGKILLTFFIESRNYGWTRYKGVLYNLNLKDESNAFIEVLKEEGFLLEGNGAYTVVDPDYQGFVNVPFHQLMFYLYFTKGTPLSKEECESMEKLE